MTAKVIKFGVPEKVRYRYIEPEDLDAPLDIFDFDARKTLGPMGKLIQDHKHLILSWLKNGEFMKPMDEWSEVARDVGGTWPRLLDRLERGREDLHDG